MIRAKIICDSINARNNARITSAILTYPRFIHSELMTHRAFSRNAASSRAIPVPKMILDIQQNPARPVHWGRHQKGMKAHEALDRETALKAISLWDTAARQSIEIVQKMVDLGVHKQVANRLLEPFSHMVTLVTATDLDNFFSLRADPDAQPEFQVVAYEFLRAYLNSAPKILKPGEWHIPFGDQMPDVDEMHRLMIATARAARISYKTFDGVIDPEKDYALYHSLMESGHWSPFEHCAVAQPGAAVRSGNFVGWNQFRKQFPTEHRTNVNLWKIAAKRTHFNWEDYQASLAA